jgi:hypothetical protein
MNPSPDPEHTAPVSNLAYLHRQQRNRVKVQDTPQARGRDKSRYELGRRDRYGERVTRIYPREMCVILTGGATAELHDSAVSRAVLTLAQNKVPANYDTPLLCIPSCIYSL